MNEEVSRDMTGEADRMSDLICDFQRRDVWWARKGDNRRGAGAAMGLKRDQVVKKLRLSGCENFV